MAGVIARALAVVRRRWLPLIAGILVAALLLARWQPWRGAVTPVPPRPVALLPTATPAVVPAPTPVPTRLALPTPGSPVAASPRPATPATPAAARAAGTILYLGTFAGQAGIVAAAVDGSGQRVIVPGSYDSLAWSPAGDRFAATGPLTDQLAQVAIFTPEGRALARYSIEGQFRSDLLWSPDGAILAYAVTPGGPRQPAPSNASVAWVIAADGPRQVGATIPGLVSPAAWVANDRLLLVDYDPATSNSSFWLADASSRGAEQIGASLRFPVGFSAPTATLVHRRDERWLGEIAALDLRTGERRTVIDADRAADGAFGPSRAPARFIISACLLAPDGLHLALYIVGLSGDSTPQPGGTDTAQALVFLRLDGTITGASPLPAGARLGPVSWSPGGTYLAAFVSGGATTEPSLHILDTGGTVRGTYDSFATGDLVVTWASDERWFAYTGLAGIGIATPDSTRGYLLAPSGRLPAWRPTPIP